MSDTTAHDMSTTKKTSVKTPVVPKTTKTAAANEVTPPATPKSEVAWEVGVSQGLLALAALGLGLLAFYLIRDVSGSHVTSTVTTTTAAGSTPGSVVTDTNGVTLPTSLISTTIIAAAILAVCAGFFTKLQSLKLPGGFELDTVANQVPTAIANDPDTKDLAPEKKTALASTAVQIAQSKYAKSKLPAKDVTTLALRDAKYRMNII